MAAQRQLTSVWLNLASILVIQLDPPDLLPVLFKTMPTAEAHAIVLNVLAVLLQTALSMFSQAGAMETVSCLAIAVALSFTNSLVLES